MAGATALLLVGFAVVGAAPLVLLVIWLFRGRRPPDDSEPESRPRRRPAGLSSALAVIAVASIAGALYLVTSSGTHAPGAVGHAEPQETATAPALPNTLAGLPATSMLDPKSALREIENLHGLSFPLVSAALARYQGEGGKAEVWAAVTRDAAEASALNRTMAEKIAEGRSPFEPPQPVDGLEGVYLTRGLGQVHYFFARGSAAWWISADEPLAERAFAQIIALA